MTKIEFLDTLRKALNGQVPPEIISENLTYYESYISDEMRRGRTETEVLEELGDPRLIARTIIDAAGGSGRRASSRSSRQDYYGSAYEEGSYDRGTAHEDDRTFSTQRSTVSADGSRSSFFSWRCSRYSAFFMPFSQPLSA